MPAESSIYWDSVGSQRSTSVGSSGDACSSGSASRNYVDPWDLENYAYLRRHSVAGLAQQASRHHRRPTYRLYQEARARSEYWWVATNKFDVLINRSMKFTIGDSSVLTSSIVLYFVISGYANENLDPFSCSCYVTFVDRELEKEKSRLL